MIDNSLVNANYNSKDVGKDVQRFYSDWQRYYDYTHCDQPFLSIREYLDSDERRSFRIEDFTDKDQRTTKIKNVCGDLFYKSSFIVDVDRGFKQCTMLSEINEHLMQYAPNVVTAKSMFEDCVYLTEIPNKLFGNNDKLQHIDNCFANTRLLKTKSLFGKPNNVLTVSGLFQRCKDLNEIDDQTFTGCNKATYFDQCFYHCHSLKSINDNVFKDCQAMNSIVDGFKECDQLSNISDDAFSNNTELVDVRGLFENTKIERVGGLFKNNNQIKKVDRLFKRCKYLKSVSSDLFGNNDNIISGDYLFSDCKSLTEIANVFSNTPNIKSLSHCFEDSGLVAVDNKVLDGLSELSDFSYGFSRCFDLKDVNVDTFSNNKKLTNLSHVFERCVNLQVVDGDLFKDNSELTDLSYAFSNCKTLSDIGMDIIFNNKKLTNVRRMFYDVSAINVKIRITSPNITDCYQFINQDRYWTIYVPSNSRTARSFKKAFENTSITIKEVNYD